MDPPRVTATRWRMLCRIPGIEISCGGGFMRLFRTVRLESTSSWKLGVPPRKDLPQSALRPQRRTSQLFSVGSVTSVVRPFWSRLSEPRYVPFLICLLITMSSCARRETGPKPAPEKAFVRATWDKVVAISKTTPTLQVVVMPPLRRGSKIHDRVFQAL